MIKSIFFILLICGMAHIQASFSSEIFKMEQLSNLVSGEIEKHSFILQLSDKEIGLNNLKLDLELEGKAKQSEIILMLHGYPDTLRLWDNQVNFFKKQYQCLRLTLPGFEKIPREENPQYSMASIRRILDLIIENLGDRKVIVMAHDWGSIYVQHYVQKTSRASHKVSKLVLLDVGDFEEGHVPYLNLKYTAALALANQVPLFLSSPIINYTLYNILKPERIDKNIDPNNLRKDNRLTYPYWQLWKDIASGNHQASIPVSDYETPVLFIYGKDKEVSFHSEEWAKKLNEQPQSKAIGIEGAGHWMMLSHAKELNQIIDQWLFKH